MSGALLRYMCVSFSLHQILISFNLHQSSMKETISLCVFSHVRLSVTPWTIARQTPLSMEFSRQEYWSGNCHFLLQGVFPTQGSNLNLLHWQVDSLPLCHQGSSDNIITI